MKNKFILLLILLVFFGFIPLQAQQSFVLKKDIVVAEGEVQDNVITLGGNVLIEGEVKEDVVAFGGSITVKGRVRGTIVGINSDINLESTAIVEGDVYSIGGVLNKEPGCVIEGDTVYFKTPEDISKFLKETFRGIFTISFIPFVLIAKLLIFFIWFIIALVIAALLPRQISFASSQIRKSFWPVFGIGFLSIIVYVGVVIFSALLCLLLIGIPLLFFFVIFGITIQIFGRVVLFYFLGESLTKAFGKSKISPLVAVILGLVLVTLIRFIPIIGFLFSFCLSIIGWGVVIRTKFGTTENWFKRS
jgi:cytoskeletal protein CcmA (bactofilin family)